MSIIITSFLYTFLFVTLYFEVFLILTIVEGRAAIKEKSARAKNYTAWPGVTIVVPVFNEQGTVVKTVNSLLQLNYPKDKLKIMIVDDGSKDNTWEFVQQFSSNPQILLHKKENGGKYTALNYAIEHCSTDFIGCLDADSFVDSQALLHIIPHFDDESVMAVTPSLKIQNPDTVLGMMQNAEYNLGIFVRKVLGLLDAQYVTPGPFSIFRKSVFKKVGMYRHAHNTEDLEMALRIQEHHYKIENAHEALVYTVGPRTVYKLYKQRVRWTGGFLQNALDYRRLMFKPEYGNFGILVLPLTMIVSLSSLLLLIYSLFRTIQHLIQVITKISLVGFHFAPENPFSLDWLLFHTEATVLFSFMSIGVVLFSIWYGRKLSGDKKVGILDTVYFLILYSVISPFWLATSVYNTIRQRDAAWR